MDSPGEVMCTLLHTLSWFSREPGAQWGEDLSCTGNQEKSTCCPVKLNLFDLTVGPEAPWLRYHSALCVSFCLVDFIPLTFDLALEVSSCRCS